ncbi:MULTISPECIES: hypothetical protein [unclassified Bradyrhizobium]
MFLLVVLALIALAWFQHRVGRYPYYAFDDMDQITALDVLLIEGGRLPDQISHPTAGMYLLVSWTQRLAYLAGRLHLRDFAALPDWTNPLLGIAELIEFLRGHLPYVAVGAALAIAGAVTLAVGEGAWMLVAVFACMLTSRTLALHTLIFRTDLFALFYAALALLLGTLALRTERRTSLAFAVLSGLACGLAVTSKVQIVPTAAAAPLLALLMMVKQGRGSAFGRIELRHNMFIMAAALAALGALLLLALPRLPEHFYHYRSSFSNIWLCGAALVAVATPGLATRYLPRDGVPYRFFSFANLMALGFVAAFPVLALVATNPLNAVRFVAAIAKVSLLGTIDPALNPHPPRLLEQFAAAPLLFMLPLVAVALLAFGDRKPTRGAAIRVLVAIGVLALASAACFSRGIVGTDVIFTEPLILLLSCLALGMVWRQHSAWLHAAAAGCAAVLALHAVAQGEITALADATGPRYFRESRQLVTCCGRGNQSAIEAVLQRRLGDVPELSRDAAFRQAANYGAVSLRIATILPNRGAIDWRRIGVLGEGLALSGVGERITRVPETLHGAAVYVPPPIAPCRAAWLDRPLAYFGLFSLEAEAWRRCHPETIRPRSDMAVLVFIPAARRAEFGLADDAPVVGISTRDYVGVTVPADVGNDLLLRLDAIAERFIVIRRAYG